MNLKKDIQTYLKSLLERPAGSLYAEDTTPKNSSKKERLDTLRQKYAGCMKCPLATQGRAQVVFGVGNPDAGLMFVGEGPGRDEDREGAPFVGRAGKLLTSIITAMGLSRENDVYISNTVKCRPPQNRTPLPHESKTCIDSILLEELAIIQPKIVCTLGATATRALLGDETRISDTRGQFIQTEYFEVLPTYHPAYLLRNPSAKKIVWDDMQKIMAKLGLKNHQR